jgi:hypothetical protein
VLGCGKESGWWTALPKWEMGMINGLSGGSRGMGMVIHRHNENAI